MAVLAPMPSASVITATSVNPGLLRRSRQPKLRFCRSPAILLASSVVSQCDQGVDRHSPACRDITSEHCDQGHDDGNAYKCEWVHGTDPVQFARQLSRDHERSN